MPILLRTVAPRPVGGSPPIQLPIAPLPKSALNNAGDKKTTSDAASASAKAIQVLLPKSPLPQTSTRKFFSDDLYYHLIAIQYRFNYLNIYN